jgi:outer membrane usher protein
VKTDYRGYTVVSNISPYRKNSLSLDTATLPDDVDLQLPQLFNELHRQLVFFVFY